MLNGSQMPIAVWIRPADPALMKRWSQLTALMDGPHLGHDQVSVINRHTRVAGASSCLEKDNDMGVLYGFRANQGDRPIVSIACNRDGGKTAWQQ